MTILYTFFEYKITEFVKSKLRNKQNLKMDLIKKKFDITLRKYINYFNFKIKFHEHKINIIQIIFNI